MSQRDDSLHEHSSSQARGHRGGGSREGVTKPENSSARNTADTKKPREGIGDRTKSRKLARGKEIAERDHDCEKAHTHTRGSSETTTDKIKRGNSETEREEEENSHGGFQIFKKN